MGSTMKPTIFNDHVATAIKHWHTAAKKHTKASRHSNHDPSGTPASSRPTTPARLLNNYTVRSEQSLHEGESQRWHELELTNESAHDDEFADGSEIARHSEVVEEERPYPANQPPAMAPDRGDISLVGK